MKQIWIRLGGYITCSEDELSKVLDGSKEALIEAIKKNGFALNGDSYIPYTETEEFEVETDDVEFDFDPGELTLKTD